MVGFNLTADEVYIFLVILFFIFISLLFGNIKSFYNELLNRLPNPPPID